MKTQDFDFYLPKELIAQTPLVNRSDSRLMIVDKNSKKIIHKSFSDIKDYLKKGDVLVLNDTKVMPCRLIGFKEDTNAKIELLLLNEKQDIWQALVKPQRRVHVNSVISFGGGLLKAKCIEKKEDGLAEFKLIYDGVLYEILDKLGQMPLPPYITKTLEDKNRYQTVYAKNTGSAAAPTAGLHFTKELLEELKNKGVIITYITLHVGLGTFRPISVENILEHKMHSEYYQISKETASILNDAIKNKNRIISVGTTTTRTLESAFTNQFEESSGFTDIFIYPSYKFKVVDSLITNFHLPKSTLIMLVSALSNKDIILNAYNVAVYEKYRFFSFGDSMFITDLKEDD